MLAVINFKNIQCKGWFSKLFLYFFPKINLKEIEEDEYITVKAIYFEVIMPYDKKRSRKRALKKLGKLMEKEKCQYFLTQKGEWTEYLLDLGYKNTDFRTYFVKTIPSAIKRLCNTMGLTPDELTICIHDPHFEDKNGEMLFGLSKLCKRMVYITLMPDKVRENIKALFDETGAAVIASQDLTLVKGIQIVVSLSQTDRLFKEGGLSFGALILTADKEYKPDFNMPNIIVNAFGVDIPQSLLNIIPDGMRAWEFIGGLYGITSNEALLSLRIYNFYSFGRNISETGICEGIRGLDKNRSL